MKGYEAKKRLDNINRYIAEKNYELAIKELEYMIATETDRDDNLEFRERLGILYNVMEQPDEAIDVFEKVLKIDSSRYWAYHGIGVGYRLKSMYDDAIRIYEKSLDIEPKAIESIFEIAICLAAKDEYEEAAEKFEEILNLSPTISHVYKSLAEMYMHLKDYKKIDAIYKKLLESKHIKSTRIRNILYVINLFRDNNEMGPSSDLRKMIRNKYKEISRADYNLRDEEEIIKLLAEDYYKKAEYYRTEQVWPLSISEYQKALSLDLSNEKAKKGLSIVLKTFHQSQKPHYCAVSIVFRCTMGCRMCHIWKNKETEEISVESWKRIIDNLAEFMDDNRTINFAGGEPLLKDGLIDLISYACGKGFKPAICTNAWFIDQKMAKRLVDSGVDIVAVSLDSLNENIHDYIRGVKGSYKRAMNAIEYLTRFGESKNVKIHIQSIISQVNLDDIIDITHLFNKHVTIQDITYLALIQPPNMLNPSHEWYKSEEFKMLWPQDKDKVNFVIDELLRLRRTDTERSYKIGNQEFQLKAFKEYFNNPVEFYKKKVRCRVGEQIINVNTNGDIQLCPYLSPISNILTQPIEEIWNSEKAVSLRKRISVCDEKCHQILNCLKEENPYM